MIKFNNTNMFAAAAFGAAALFSMLSFGGNAEAASVLSCKGASATKVASCCEKVVEENGRRPLWMVQNRMNCHEATVCRGGGGTVGVAALVVNRCYIHVMLIDGDGGNKKDGRGRGAK
jgi:hypothetical protein